MDLGLGGEAGKLFHVRDYQRGGSLHQWGGSLHQWGGSLLLGGGSAAAGEGLEALEGHFFETLHMVHLQQISSF